MTGAVAAVSVLLCRGHGRRDSHQANCFVRPALLVVQQWPGIPLDPCRRPRSHLSVRAGGPTWPDSGVGVTAVHRHRLPLAGAWTRDAIAGITLAALVVLAATVVVGLTHSPAAGGRFLTATGGVLAGLGVLSGDATRHGRSQPDPQPITLATWVTVGRGIIVAAVAGLVAAGGLSASGLVGWLPGLLVGVAGVLDRLDGWVARTRNAETALGRRLDVETDAALVFVGTVAVVVGGLAPVWVLCVGLARYLYLLARWAQDSRPAVQHESRRQLNRLLYVLVVGAVCVALLPVTTPDLTRPLLSVVAVPFLVNFLRSWLAGRESP